MKRLATVPIFAALASATMTTGQAVAAPKTEAKASQHLTLWGDGQAPVDAEGTKTEEASVSLRIHRPAKPNGTAVVVCAGGGYGMNLWKGAEGVRTADWLNQHGILAAVLEYRLPRGNPWRPLSDVKQAIRMVRSRAEGWGIDPHRIGIIGYSAGGHLASMAATKFNAGDLTSPKALERISCRPDFAILIYPVITMGTDTHAGSKKNLLGKSPSEEMAKLFSSELQVTPDTPPTFLAHAVDDKPVPPSNSKMFHNALLANRVQAKYLQLPDGGHGLNGYKGPSWEAWKTQSLNWLRVIRMLPESEYKDSTSMIDAETIRKWSEPYRDWHYYPHHVIAPKPNVKGYEDVAKTDVPTVFQLPGDAKWYLSFIGFDGKGYQSFIAESDDLVNWSNMRLAMGYGPEGTFDYGGVVLGAYLYEDYDIKAPRILKERDGKYWSLYGAYPRQGGYELRPGYEGVASSADGLNWTRAKDEPILSVHQEDCGEWEKDCIYQPWLVEHDGSFFNYYNAANGHIEQLGLAHSDDLLTWKRHAHNPVIRNGPKGSYNEKFSSDGKVFQDGDHWVCFFFGVGKGGAHILAAYSWDLRHWTVDPEPLYKAGGNPSGLDKKYAHKVSLVWNPANETYYMFYNAVGNKGRGIGLITSKPLTELTHESLSPHSPPPSH